MSRFECCAVHFKLWLYFYFYGSTIQMTVITSNFHSKQKTGTTLINK